jgi:hypothetical protein
MTSRIATDERQHFSDRLQLSLRKAGVPVRVATVAREFNLRANGARVTTHAVRKWLLGDAMPTHERLVILADWLGVHASWLLYGDTDPGEFPLASSSPALASEELMLVGDYRRLAPEGKKTLRAILNILLGTMGRREQTQDGLQQDEPKQDAPQQATPEPDR